MKSLIILTVAASALFAAPALAQSPSGARPNPFDQIDTNRDGIITTAEATAGRAAMFDRLDTDRNGSLSRDEMRASRAMQERPMHGGPRPGGRDRGPARTNADTNNDGVVTRAEWDARTTASGQEAARRASEMFSRLDTNNDGQLSTAELQAGRASVRERVTTRREERRGNRAARPQRANIDSNNDGQISRAEWMAVPDRMHQRADANNDGQVTRAEAEAAWQRGVRAPAGQR
jgi:Ca2+-binding EF-hand superfamily protein